jgi:hypothetical protein
MVEKCPEVLLMLFAAPGEKEDVVQVAKQKSSPLSTSSINRWNVWAALRRPKDINGNSKRPKGVVMAVFWMSLEWTGIWLYALTRSILE